MKWMKCDRCDSARIINVNGKTADLCITEYAGKENDGYVPEDTPFGKGGWGDFIAFKLCLECGKMQGKFPAPDPDTSKWQ